MYRLLVTLGILLYPVFLFSQINLPEVVPSSPEMRGLGMYGEIPANAYTGVPDISIPLHTVTIGELSLPITLSYHATGIQVTQEASWVGLGWNLIAGGAISYVQVGGNDRLVQAPTVPAHFIRLLDYVAPTTFPQVKPEDQLVMWDCIPVDDDANVQSNVVLRMLEGYGEQDIYSANFLNYSFKFFKDIRSSSYQFLGQKSNVKINSDLSIIGEDGTKYFFEGVESRGYARLGYHLTKIVHPSGDEITLKYSNISALYIPPLSEYIGIHGRYFSDEARRNVANSHLVPHQVPYLDTIQTEKEWVIFERDDLRDDLNGGAKLNRVVIIDRLTLTEKFSYNFSYSYFIGEPIGGNYLTDREFEASSIGELFTLDQVRKRLKLESIVQISNSRKNKIYSFDYNETVPLPYKTSFAIDHWGYYNGQNNVGSKITGCSHTIIPKIAPLTLSNPTWINDLPKEFYGFSGATRGASADYITAGILKSIRYPTGGRTEFEFEPHDFDNHQYISAEDEIEHITASYNNIQLAAVISFPNNPIYSVMEDEFTISEQVLATFSGVLHEYADPYMTLEAVDVSGEFSTIFFNFDNRTSSSEGNVAEWNTSIWLQPGTYKLKCHVEGSFPDVGLGPVISGTLSTMEYFQEDWSHLPSLGGGVRVKEISNYDSNDTKLSSKKYSYLDENGTTSGKLMLPLKYLKHKEITVGLSSTNTTSSTFRVELSGSSYVSLSGLTYGNNVGYDRVEVETFSGLGENGSGKEIHYFSNNVATVFANDISYFGNRTNGDLLRRVLLDHDNDTVWAEVNSYSIVPGSNTIAMVNAQAVDYYIGPTDVCLGLGGFFNPLAYPSRFLFFVYPYEGYFNALATKRVFSQYSSGNPVTVTENYTYNSDHLQLSEKAIEDSRGKTIEEYYYYPEDFSNSVGYNLPDLKSKNIIKPIKIEKTTNGNQISGDIIKYNATGQPLERLIYRNDELEQRIIHDPITYIPSNHYQVGETWTYVGNKPAVHTPVSGVKQSYYWVGDKPIVLAENVNSWSVVNAAVLSSLPHGYSSMDQLHIDMYDITTNDSKRDIWRNFNTSLRTILGDSAMITTYTFDTVFGMTSKTDPNGITTYYEYDAFGRLSLVKDSGGGILQKYEYHYQE